MRIQDVVEKTTKFLKDKGFESCRLESEILVSSALKLRRIDLYLKYEQPLEETELQICREHLRRRISGEPVAYIVGSKDFYNLNFKTDSRALIPRPETEQMVELAAGWIKAHENQSEIRLLDLGCGTGCIGLTLAKNFPKIEVTLVDISKETLNLAQENAQILGLTTNVEFIHSAVCEMSMTDRKWNLILANPPYISPDDIEVEAFVKKFEPHQALFSAQDGMQDALEWSTHVSRSLSIPGLMIFEMGRTQGQRLSTHFTNQLGLEDVRIEKDFSDFERFVVGTRKA
jgi:release factor glutamine methyltransferase